MSDDEGDGVHFFYIEDANGTLGVFDQAGFDAEVKRLVAVMMVAETPQRHIDDTIYGAVLKVHVEHKSVGYLEKLVDAVAALAVLYAAHEANGFQVTIIMNNLNRLINVWRMHRDGKSVS